MTATATPEPEQNTPRPEDSSKKKSSPEQLSVTRRWFARAAGAGIALGLAAGVDAIHAGHWKGKQQETYGTVAQPTYRITAQLPSNEAFGIIEQRFAPLPPEAVEKQQGIEAIREGLEKGEKEYASLEKQVQAFGSLDKPSLDDQKEFHDHSLSVMKKGFKYDEVSTRLWMASMSQDSDDLVRGLEDIERNVTAMMISRFDSSEIDEQALAMTLFTELTGQPLPDVELKMEEKLGEGTAGYHSPLEGKIAYKDLRTIHNLITLLHEEGHLVAQHSEQAYKGLIHGNLFGIHPEVKALDEACAFAFCDAGLHALPKSNEQLAKLSKFFFESYLLKEITAYYEGGCTSQEEHERGVAIYLAARAVYNDPAQTFNALATVQGSTINHLDSRVRQEMQSHYQTWKAMQNVPEEMDTLKERSDALAKQYQALHKQCEAIESRLKKQWSAIDKKLEKLIESSDPKKQ